MMDIWRGTSFGEAFRECKLSFTRTPGIPYRLRAQLDSAARQTLAEKGFSSGDQMRFGACLFKACALKTYPNWESHVGKSEISNFISMIDHHLEGKIDQSESLSYLSMTRRIVQDRIYEWDEHLIDQAGVAGMSCVTAVAYALNSFSFDQVAETERDTDTSNWDSAFLSSIAEAGGAEWQVHERDLNNKARIEFWRWYLAHAVPKSMEQATRNILS